MLTSEQPLCLLYLSVLLVFVFSPRIVWSVGVVTVFVGHTNSLYERVADILCFLWVCSMCVCASYMILLRGVLLYCLIAPCWRGLLIRCLKKHVGISDVALDWFISYLWNRSFSVRFGEASSSCAPLFWGVPQGSILGPLLFTVYMLSLGQTIRRHNIDFHWYADDTQFYVPLQPGKSDVSRIFSCLAGIKNWKSDIVIMNPSGPSTSYYTNLYSSLGALSNNVWKEAHNLGVIFDS